MVFSYFISCLIGEWFNKRENDILYYIYFMIHGCVALTGAKPLFASLLHGGSFDVKKKDCLDKQSYILFHSFIFLRFKNYINFIIFGRVKIPVTIIMPQNTLLTKSFPISIRAWSFWDTPITITNKAVVASMAIADFGFTKMFNILSPLC